ncbi:hypothetical protein CHS0354_002024 [Potamilus streckersoni]|uniref:Aspartokinase n=1 Tax=Potamilus streckersoni TaxID=2493646 RepID=A0AAE0W7D7_9BIVA|nr:hypothetical protein CHS0354_002024 [Potamilus streckersoni]
MEYIVQKFGGTSVGTAERIEKVGQIISAWSKQYKVIVTVSAISSYTKSEGTTSKLILAKELAEKHGPYIKVIDEIEELHINTVKELLKDTQILSAATAKIAEIIKKLKSFLSAVEIIHETTPRIEDVIVSTGEKLSAVILSAALNAGGTDAEYIDLSAIVEDNLYKDTGKEYYDYVKRQIAERISRASGVPVLTGFFGYVPEGILKAVGRGYTDLTASLTAAAVSAKELQIWKEVDGIFSADPRKVLNARVLPSVTPAEAAELTYYGSEVIHPFTMEQATGNNIPIRIKNTFNPDGEGTLVDPRPQEVHSHKATAVTAKTGIFVLNINSNRMQKAHGFMHKIFKIFDEHRISIDLISTSEVNVSMTIDKKYNVSKVAKELEEFGTVNIFKDVAIISLIGEGMRNAVGMSHKFFEALAERNINIEMISQGASEINISCVINENHVPEALNEIHRRVLE